MAKQPPQLSNLDQHSAPFFFFGTDSQCRLTFLSASAFTALGRSREELIESAVIVPVPSEQLEQELFGEPAQTTTSSNRLDEVMFARILDRTLFIQAYLDHSSGGFCGVSLDITDKISSEKKLRNRQRRINEMFANLSPREQRVLAYLPQGRSIKNIARALNLSERGIEHIKARLLKKLNAKNNAELIAIFVERKKLNEFLVTRNPSDII